MKKVRVSIAAFVRHAEDDRFLAVLRPPDDDRLPDVWGLPAVTLGSGELPEAGLRRIGREKLGTELEPIRLIGTMSADRGDHVLVLMDIEARYAGAAPDVAKADTTGTRYVDQRWTEDLDVLVPAARMGSLCCRIALEAAGREY